MGRDIYTERIEKLRQENIKEVKKLLERNDKGLLKKIKNASQRYQINEKYIKGQIIKEEPIALSMFSKDPTKQNTHERIAADYIRNMQGVKNFKKLNNNELYVASGQVISKDQAQLSKAKTIDFYFEYKEYKIYVSHKHTTEEGGAQDNQYKDLQQFVLECGGGTDSKKVFIAIADGKYYEGNNGKAGVSKMDNLKSKCTQSVKVCAIYQLEEVLKKLQL